jgi:hypothetical protein
MSSIENLLFGGDGNDGDGLLDLIAGGILGGITDSVGEGIAGDGGTDRRAAGRVRRAGGWCGSTPDHVSSGDGWRGSPRPTI